jgi:hypothetical protein
MTAMLRTGVGLGAAFSPGVPAVDVVRRPHPVFARVLGYARWSETVPYYSAFEITLAEIGLIAAYVDTLRSPG